MVVPVLEASPSRVRLGVDADRGVSGIRAGLRGPDVSLESRPPAVPVA
jgi:hypothetical protein